jgi:hypothetical protein
VAGSKREACAIALLIAIARDLVMNELKLYQQRVECILGCSYEAHEFYLGGMPSI